jgi:hypothetical protein
MGQILTKKGLESRHCSTVGLYDSCSWDPKTLKKLIIEKKLAPIFVGTGECKEDLDECPICMLYYPFLNLSNCCKKSICTECFTQVRRPLTTESEEDACPFCLTKKYTVSFIGRRTEAELRKEREEEQKVSQLERQATARSKSVFTMPSSPIEGTEITENHSKSEGALDVQQTIGIYILFS